MPNPEEMTVEKLTSHIKGLVLKMLNSMPNEDARNLIHAFVLDRIAEKDGDMRIVHMLLDDLLVMRDEA